MPDPQARAKPKPPTWWSLLRGEAPVLNVPQGPLLPQDPGPPGAFSISDLVRGATGFGDQGPPGPTWTNAAAVFAALPPMKGLKAFATGATKADDVVRGIRAYHGSPHDFDKFDLSKVGTGEGAQAYGHGLYFAENPGVAEIYRNNLAGFPEIKNLKLGGLNVGDHNAFDYSPKGNSIYENIRSSLAEDVLLDQASLTGVPPDRLQAYVLQHMDEKIRDFATEWPEAVEEAKRLRADLARPRAVSLTFGERPGRTYEVNIRADPNALIDLDAPIQKQPPAVVDLIRERLKAEGYLRPNDNGPRQLQSALASWRMERAGMSETPMQALVGARGSGSLISGTPEEISASLRDRGVPGIKYLDQVSRMGTTGTRNYVVFDDALIDILKKYGVALPAIDLLRRQAEQNGGRVNADDVNGLL